MIPFLAHDLARGGNHLAGSVLFHPAQRFQDRADFVPGQTRAGGERELPLYIVSGEQKHAICRRLVTACAARLLQIILQRSWNIAMHDETDIGLVYAHAKGVGRGDHP